MSTVKRPDDAHYKATLSVALHGARLQFHVAQDLFSSAFLDPGTGMLLRSLAGAEYSRVLDLGCGYGPLGLFLKAWRPESAVTLVDRDELAVRFASMNGDLNDLDVSTGQSLGYDDVAAGGFDLIVSNIPAKAGPLVIHSLLVDGHHFLVEGGTMAVVAISRLATQVRSSLERAGAEVMFERDNRGYLCVHYRFAAPPAGEYVGAFGRGAYDRGRTRYGKTEITTVYGLPEFDTPGFATQLAIKLLPTLKGRVVVLNPGQGLVPAAAGQPVSVADRDLLAVRNAARNTTLTDGRPDVAVALVRQGEPVAVTLADIDRHDVGDVLVAGTSTQVTRLVEAMGGDVVARQRKKGFSAAIIRR